MMRVYGCRASGLTSHDSTGWLYISTVDQSYQNFHEYLGDMVTLHIRVQFFEQVYCVLGTEAAKMLVLEEEVHTQVRRSNDSRVLDSELANAGQDKVLQCLDTNNAGTTVDQENV
jgi:hypothetical protein